MPCKGQLDEAIAAWHRAIDLKPGFTLAHNNLSSVLSTMGRFDDAIVVCRRAIALKPDSAEAHCDLGFVLWKKGRLDDAAAAFHQAIDLKPDYAVAYYNLGNVLIENGRLDEAVTAWRHAIELKPDLAEAHCNLGSALRQQGEFAQALAALKEGHELGSRRKDWPYTSSRWVRECQRLIELDGRLRAVLKGEAQPANAAERNEYAQLCCYKKLYVASARLRAGAFTADPKLADDLKAGYRYDAACAAALAACGQGTDAGQLDDQERVCWRKQALEWLRADLEQNGKLLESRKPEDHQLVQQRLRHWQCDHDLAGLRDSAAVGQLPADEKAECKQLWAEVEALLAKASAAK
jgi:tetratricopeptide (TPR) repeat protein